KGQAELAGLAIAPLLIGDNVLAVEVHQTSGDTAELVFGMSLLAATQHPAVFTDPSQPPDRSVGAGDPTTFSAEFIGTPPLSLQWLKDGNPITGATAERLTIDPVLQADAGSYSLKISNPLATNVTRSALLTVTNSPVRVTDPNQPADRTVTEGLPASFTVLAAGSAPLSYQWFKADSTGTNSIPDATNATFSIPDVRMSDAGDYFAVVTNPFPSNTRTTFKSSIVIDGSFDDWAGVPLAFSDPQDSTESLDYKDVYITNDDDFIYLRVTLWAPGDFSDFHNNLFIDADNDVATGYAVSGIGSDLLMQSGGGYEEQPGAFNNGTASALDWRMMPVGARTNIEFRLSRLELYDNTGLPVFTTNRLAI